MSLHTSAMHTTGLGHSGLDHSGLDHAPTHGGNGMWEAVQPPRLLLTEIHSDTEAYLSTIYEIDGDTLIVETSPASATVGSYIWVEFAVGDARPVRILTKVTRRNPEETWLRVKYLWPRHRAALVEMLSA